MIQDENVPIEVRITAPITWDVQMKFIIQDLRENHFDEVIKLIKHHYFYNEPMSRSVELVREKVSLDFYLELIKAWMKDESSLVALSRKTGRVVGALICKINRLSEKSNVYSRVQIFPGETLSTIMTLKSAVIQKANVYEKLECEKYLRIYIQCVHPSYMNKPVAKAFLETSCLNAFYLELPIVGGVFTSSRDQRLAENVGFKMHTEIAYNEWSVDEEVIFDDPGVGNYSAAFMFMKTPDEQTLINKTKAKAIELNKELRKREKKK